MNPIEKNGAANCISFIRLFKKANPEWEQVPGLSPLLKKIETECWDTMDYLNELSNPSGILWSQIKERNKDAKR